MERAIRIISENRIGVLRDLTTIIAKHGGNITYSHTFLIKYGEHRGKALIYFEVEGGDFEKIMEEIKNLEYIIELEEEVTFEKVYGKRVIILGGGALVLSLIHI